MLLFYDVLLGTTSSDMTIDVTSTTFITVTATPNPSTVAKLTYHISSMYWRLSVDVLLIKVTQYTIMYTIILTMVYFNKFTK